MTISMPEQAVELIKGIAKKRQEHFGVICLDCGREFISKKNLFIGSTCNAIVDLKVILWEACSKKSSAIIVYHNHPGGTACPSMDDFQTTKEIKAACDIVKIPLLDHIIVTKNDFYSFREHKQILVDKDEKEALVAE